MIASNKARKVQEKWKRGTSSKARRDTGQTNRRNTGIETNMGISSDMIRPKVQQEGWLDYVIY
jgi:hypothetical protein